MNNWKFVFTIRCDESIIVDIVMSIFGSIISEQWHVENYITSIDKIHKAIIENYIRATFTSKSSDDSDSIEYRTLFRNGDVIDFTLDHDEMTSESFLVIKTNDFIRFFKYMEFISYVELRNVGRSIRSISNSSTFPSPEREE